MTDNLPATIGEQYGTGLEDLEGEISVVPRIGINHAGGTFKDSLSGEEFAKITGVALGIIKQRVMWEPGDIEAGAKPQCKSQDGQVGYPNMSGKPGESFPWATAPGLDPNTASRDEHNRPIIECKTCPFAQWGERDAKGKSKPPLCKERHTYPVIYNRGGDPSIDPTQPPFMESGIVSFQGSGIKPSKMFAAAFVRNKLPLYTAIVEISLDVNKRGMVEYSVPKFVKLGNVPEGDWEIYAREYQPLRDFLRAAPRADDDGSDPVKGSGQSAAQAAANAGIQQAHVTVAQPTVQTPAAPVQATVATPTVQAPATVVQSAPVAEPAAAPDFDPDELPF